MINKRLANLCLVAVMASSVILAQTAKTPRVNTDELRQYQLRVFREHVLARALDSIKKMDEAGLRVSARIQILTYLTRQKVSSDEKQTLATQIARDALRDLREHNEEITPFMLSYLSNELVSWVQKYRPNMVEEFEKTINEMPKIDKSLRIRALFDLEGGDILAAKRIRQELENHDALNALDFWLDELMTRNSKEFEPLASDVVTRAARGELSFETLFWISNIYLRPQTSNALRNRFLATVVARTQPANFVAEPAPRMAYNLLTNVLPSVQRSTPELYDQALNNSFAMRASLSEKELASEARIKRLNESENPIADLRSEAASAKTKTERNELLLRAAEVALEKKKFDLCLDILDEIDVNAVAADSDLLQRSIDQLLQNFVKSALAARLTDLAEKGAAHIALPLMRVDSLNLILRYYAKANDKEAAQRLLTEATKVAALGPNTTEKAKAFFLLSVTCDQVDVSRKAELLSSGLKVLNNLSRPDANASDKTIYQTYVRLLDNAGYELVRSFKGLTKQDENDALALVEKLQKPDLKTYALIGILLGLDELLTAPAK
jgi:hypothetical protein